MSDSKSNEVQIEGTRFYKRSNFREALRIIVVTVVIFSSTTILALGFALDTGARQAYKEARDIRKALRAVGTEFYGDMSSIYNPNDPTGLSKGAAEKIAEISRRNGTVILYEWDETTNAPIKFEYRKGLYQVIYVDSGERTNTQSGLEGNFKVYYSLELLNYDVE
ncbi:hypothetical protein B0O40_0043 [Ruminococcaceae bacterium R-25]|nr:hypothetical protein B0O40_0043 [Ruminococcaceae bacterium R-25]SUQ10692.1 hypothetical protein SAMN06297423_0043 [Oscillospiraceae bacterium]